MLALYWVLCLIIALIPAFFIFKKDRKKNLPLKWLPALLRFIVFFLTAAVLLAPSFPREKKIEEKPVVLWLQDESSSMKKALTTDSQKFKENSQKLWKSGKGKYEMIPLGFGEELTRDHLFQYQQHATNMSSALEDVLKRYENTNVAALVIASDGNYNTGSNPLYLPEATQFPIYTIGIGDTVKPKDLNISFARANKTTMLGNSFELLVSVQAEKLNKHTSDVAVYHQGQVVARQSFDINNDYFNRTFRFYISADKKGLQHYSIVAAEVEGETNLNNNRTDVFVEVIEKEISILVAASAPHPDIAAIKEALSQNQEYKLKMLYADEIPTTVSGYDVLITHNLPDGRGNQIPRHNNMPVWNIIGLNTDLNAFSRQQNLLQIQAIGGQDNSLPSLNTSFNLFVLPKDIRAVLAQMPPLKFPIANYQLSGGQVLLHRNTQNGQRNNPLWIVHTGQSPQAILCGTELWRWRAYSFKSFKQAEGVDELIRQTITLLAHQSNKEPFKILLPKYQYQDYEAIRFSASLQDPTGALTNSPNAELVLKDSAGNEQKYSFEKSGKSYLLSVGNLPAGAYSYSGSVHFNGRDYTDNGRFKVHTMPLEDLKTHSDYSVLYQLAQNSGGRFFTLDNMVEVEKALMEDENLKPLVRMETVYLQWIDLKWLFFIILMIAGIEWTIRKYWGI